MTDVQSVDEPCCSPALMHHPIIAHGAYTMSTYGSIFGKRDLLAITSCWLYFGVMFQI